jgi:hypothetical protein
MRIHSKPCTKQRAWTIGPLSSVLSRTPVPTICSHLRASRRVAR